MYNEWQGLDSKAFLVPEALDLRTGIPLEARIASFAGGHWGGLGGRKVRRTMQKRFLGQERDLGRAGLGKSVLFA